MEFAGQRVTLLGLGHHGGGLGAARYLARRGARVTVADEAPPESLATPLAELAKLAGVAVRLGPWQAGEWLAADLLVVNPAVRPHHPLLQRAIERGIPLTSEIELALRALRCPALGVSGSVGKSSTAAMVAEILRHAGRQVWLGGNFGGSLLDALDALQPTDVAVVELSSFQLARLPEGFAPLAAGALTNCVPNHLDWHGDWPAYRAAKARLLRLVRPGGGVALGPALEQDPHFQPPSDRALAPHYPIEQLPPLAVEGLHQRQNAALAAALAHSQGASRAQINAGLSAFGGLPHRLTCLGQRAGRWFYDDSKSTTPESTLAALAALARPVWLLLGGVGKGADYRELIAHAAHRARGVATFGQMGAEFATRLTQARGAAHVGACRTLDEALDWAFRHSAAGDAILLSPACASFDQFRDYADRAAHFAQCVQSLR